MGNHIFAVIQNADIKSSQNCAKRAKSITIQMSNNICLFFVHGLRGQEPGEDSKYVDYSRIAWTLRGHFGTKMAATEEVDYYQLYKIRPLLLHFYVGPFILIYLVWLYMWTVVYGVKDYFEIGAIIVVAIIFLQILVWLFCLWSVHVRCLLTCSKVRVLLGLS